MCLSVRNKFGKLPQNGWIPKTAEKDIVVYKILEYRLVEGRLPHHYKKIYFTPFQQYLIKFNIFGKCVMKAERMTGRVIYTDGTYISSYLLEGFKEILDEEKVFKNSTGLLIDKGIHAYTKLFPITKHGSYEYRELHKAIIPKGAHYFVDEVLDEIVADKMIILKKVVK